MFGALMTVIPGREQCLVVGVMEDLSLLILWMRGILCDGDCSLNEICAVILLGRGFGLR